MEAAEDAKHMQKYKATLEAAKNDPEAMEKIEQHTQQFLSDAQLEAEILESHLNGSDTNPHKLGFRPTEQSKAEQTHLEKMEAKNRFGFYESFWSTISPSIRRLAQTPKTPWSTNGRSPRTPGNGSGNIALPPRQDSFQLDPAPTLYHHVESATQNQQ